MKRLILFFGVLFAAGCSVGESETSSVGPTPAPEVEKEKPKTGSRPQICSALNFENVEWPEDYVELDTLAFSLASNITGSFEGHAGWTNLSNNFDGQGFSMGLLNQNLGQGTIQPLLLYMRDHHLSVLENAMTSAMLKSLLKMLKSWEKSNPWTGSLAALANDSLAEEDRQRVLVDDPNIEKKYGFSGFQSRSNSKSVRWAKKTLYSDSNGRIFKPAWKDALKKIAGDPAYVSQQIKAAQYIHDRAMDYRDRLGWGQLRSYLFLFDIVVQNGSLKDKHFEQFDRWLANQTRATEEEQMLEMLAIRVVDSHPKWQEDVRRRKTTIIKGTGFVHGENRNLPVEYCYDPLIAY